MSRLDAEELEQFAARLLEEAGADSNVASQVSESLVAADLRGHETHGVFRIPWYVEGIEDLDWIDPRATPTVVRESLVTGVVDGGSTFGQVAGRVALDAAIEKADRTGVGVVGVRDATHLGRIGEWAERAADAGFIGMLQVGTQGGTRTVAPAGSADRLYSTNPIAYGIPTFGALGFPIILDIATSQVAHGKIRTIAKEEEEPVPDGWTTTETGDSVTDAEAFVEKKDGALLPLGGRTAGYKGYGLSVVAELLGTIIGDGVISGQQNLERSQNVAACHVIDPTRFTTVSAIEDRIRTFADHIRSANYSSDIPLGPGAYPERGLLPGEPEHRYLTDRSENGIPLAEETRASLHELAIRFGVAEESPFSTTD